MSKRFFPGNSVQQALVSAARHYEIPPEELAYRLLEKRHGFLKARRNVVIEVDPDNPRQPPRGSEPQGGAAEVAPAPAREVAPAPPAGEPAARAETDRRATSHSPAPATPTEPRPEPEPPHEPEPRHEVEPARGPGSAAGEQVDEGASPIDRALSLLAALAGLELTWEVDESDPEMVRVELAGADRDRLVDDGGRLLLALEHLTPRLVRGLTGEWMRFRLDSGDYHAARWEELGARARLAASEVRRDGRAFTFEAMNPYERRIVHLHIAEIDGVESASIGDGLVKRVSVRPEGPGAARDVSRETSD